MAIDDRIMDSVSVIGAPRLYTRYRDARLPGSCDTDVQKLVAYTETSFCASAKYVGCHMARE